LTASSVVRPCAACARASLPARCPQVKPSKDAEELEPGAAYLPQARVRKLIKMNGEVKSFSKEALFAASKAAEVFLGLLSTQ